MTQEEKRAKNRESQRKYRLRHPEKVKEANARHRAKHPERRKELQRKSYYDNYAHSMFKTAQKRAKTSNREFTITVEDIVIPENCPIFDRPFIYGGGPSNKDNSPSLDRIDSNGGYTPDNIRVISFRANRHKGDMTKEEAIKLAERAFED